MLLGAQAIDQTRTAAWKRRSGARGHDTNFDNEDNPSKRSPKGQFDHPKIHLIDEFTPIETLAAAIDKGEYLLSETKMEHVHRAYLHLLPLVEAKQRPSSIETYDDYLAVQQAKVRASNLLLLKRSFWEYDDFRDAELCRSFGLQSVIFDTYAWNNRLATEFQDYVDKYFSMSDHSHLTYFEYCQLLRYFYFSYAGIAVRPAFTSKKDKLRPEFGVPVPEGPARAPIALFRNWISNFQRTLGIHNALVIKTGCGIVPMVARDCGVRRVMGVDPDPRAILSATRDARRLRFHDIAFKVGSFFPDDAVFQADGDDDSADSNAAYLKEHETEAPAVDQRNGKKSKFDMIVYAPDVSFLQLSARSSNGVDTYAPSMTGLRGDLDRFFEEAHRYMNTGPRGSIVVILFSNFLQLAYPKEPHPIELEIKTNRRWVLLDYFDRSMDAKLHLSDVTGLGARLKVFRNMASELRAELWVLHRVEDMFKFGWMHGIPGCRPAGAGGGGGELFSAQGQRRMALRRAQLLKDKVMSENGNWGEYKQRMLRAMQEIQDHPAAEDGGDDQLLQSLPEDDVAQSVRMAIDPTYPDRLAAQARRAVEANLQKRRQFHAEVATKFLTESPRQRHDHEQREALASVGVTSKNTRGSTGASSAIPQRRSAEPKQRRSDETQKQQRSL